MRALTVGELEHVSGGWIGPTPPPIIVPGTRQPSGSGSNLSVIFCNGECGKLDFGLPDFDAMMNEAIDAAVLQLCDDLTDSAGAAIGGAVGGAIGHVGGSVAGGAVGGVVGGAIGSTVPGVGNAIGAVTVGSVASRLGGRYGTVGGAAAGAFLGKAAAAGVRTIACPSK